MAEEQIVEESSFASCQESVAGKKRFSNEMFENLPFDNEGLTFDSLLTSQDTELAMQSSYIPQIFETDAAVSTFSAPSGGFSNSLAAKIESPTKKRRPSVYDSAPIIVADRRSAIVYTQVVGGKVKSDSRKKITAGCVDSTFEKQINAYLRLGQSCSVFEYDVKDYIKAQMKATAFYADCTEETEPRKCAEISGKSIAYSQAVEQYAEACTSYRKRLETVYRWTFYGIRFERALLSEASPEDEKLQSIRKRIQSILEQRKQELNGRVERLRQAKKKLVKWTNGPQDLPNKSI